MKYLLEYSVLYLSTILQYLVLNAVSTTSLYKLVLHFVF